MLTFNVVLGYQDLLFRDFLWFFFCSFFFFSIRPTDSISGNAFDAKRNFEFAQQRNRHWLRVVGTKSWTGRSKKSAQFRLFRADHFWPLGGRVYRLEFLDNYGKLSTDFEIACTSLFWNYYILRYYIMRQKSYYNLRWKIITFCVEILLHFALILILRRFLLHFALILHFAAIITFCGVTEPAAVSVSTSNIIWKSNNNIFLKKWLH